MEDTVLNRFVRQVRIAQTVNLPKVAESMDLNWFTDLKPLLDSNPDFKTALEQVFGEMKFALLDKLLIVGRDGKNSRGRNPEISYIRAVIQAIDAGEILGSSASGAPKTEEPVMTPEEEAEHLRRLNIKGAARE